jgi:hypothetical protein
MHAKMYATDEAQAEFADNQLNHYWFVYRQADSNNHKVGRMPFSSIFMLILALAFQRPFQGPLIGPILATHFASISGASNVSGLCPVTGWPVATLTLAVATMHFHLLSFQFVNICDSLSMH